MAKGRFVCIGSWETHRIGKPILEKLLLGFSCPARLLGCLALFTLLLPAHSQPLGPLTAFYVLNFNGNRVVVDSFDSSDPAHSVWQTNWFYNGSHYGTYTNTLRKDNATVATDGSLLYADGATIYGYVNTAPGGLVGGSSGAAIGDLNWIGTDPINPNNFGIQQGHQREDMAMSFPDVALPAPATWFSVPAPTSATIVVGGTTYNYVKIGGKWGYQIGGVLYSLIITNRTGQPGTPTNKIYYQYSSSLDQSIFIDASNVVLSLPSGIQFGSGDNLTVNTNANVEIYSGGDMDTYVGLVNNLNQYAPALIIYGLSGCVYISFGGNAVLTTSLYAPEASLIFNGGGNTAYQVVGSLLVQNITINGHYDFHFDELNTSTTFPIWVVGESKNKAIPVGSNTTFSISTTGGSPMNYGWFFNQTNPIASGTNWSLSLTNVQLSDAGSYSVVVTNLAGSVTSSPAILFVYTNISQLAARLDTFPSSTNNQFQFNLAGVTGLNYAIQASTNLTDWASLLTNSSPFTFSGINPGTIAQRFYRAIYVP
jgi:hypothetical protein